MRRKLPRYLDPNDRNRPHDSASDQRDVEPLPLHRRDWVRGRLGQVLRPEMPYGKEGSRGDNNANQPDRNSRSRLFILASFALRWRGGTSTARW